MVEWRSCVLGGVGVVCVGGGGVASESRCRCRVFIYQGLGESRPREGGCGGTP